jgi:hypothetical protein
LVRLGATPGEGTRLPPDETRLVNCQWLGEVRMTAFSRIAPSRAENSPSLIILLTPTALRVSRERGFALTQLSAGEGE